MLKIALVSPIMTGVTKENRLFISEKGTVVKYRKGYDRSEKRHGAREKGMAQRKHYAHVITCQVSHQK